MHTSQLPTMPPPPPASEAAQLRARINELVELACRVNDTIEALDRRARQLEQGRAS
jgi:hypothetical protein